MQRFTDLTISLIATVVSFFLSWPFWRDFEYWAESRVAWYVYFVLGFVLGVYVFLVFIGSLRMLFLHGHEEHGATPSKSEPKDGETRP